MRVQFVGSLAFLLIGSSELVPAQSPIKVPPGGIKLPAGQPLRLPPGSRSTPLVLKPKQPDVRTPPELECEVMPGNTIFPAMLFAGANMRDTGPPGDLVLGEGARDNAPAVRVATPVANAPVVVTVACDEVMEPSTFRGVLAKANEVYTILPKILWKYKALAQSRQQVPVNVVFRVRIGDAPEIERVCTCSLRTINDCPLQFVVGDELAKVELVFAAYVNEDHPWVDSLLKSALFTGLTTAFTGYQQKSEDAVLLQVEAVWRALQRHNISYSSITTLAAPQTPRLMSQHVRFLDESLAAQQANCIDGTVMIASILRKIGINTRIVLVPGHAFLAIDLDPKADRIVGLETTCLGEAKIAIGVPFEQESRASFQRALEVGTQRLVENAARFGSTAPGDAGYVIVDVAAARLHGVQPIPYTPPPGAATTPPKLIRIR